MISALVIVLVLICFLPSVSYPKTYVALLLGSAFIPLVSMILLARAINSEFWLGWVIAFPSLLFICSCLNLFWKGRIATSLTITGMILSSALGLTYLFFEYRKSERITLFLILFQHTYSSNNLNYKSIKKPKGKAAKKKK
jgi:hypothetical protein